MLAFTDTRKLPSLTFACLICFWGGRGSGCCLFVVLIISILSFILRLLKLVVIKGFRFISKAKLCQLILYRLIF